MIKSRIIVLLAVVVVASVWTIREWQIFTVTTSRGGIGPDVIVGDIPDIRRWGADSDETAFSIATTSCNIGDARLDWISNSNVHPVISQNLYRIKDGRIEQIGMSWLKHGFAVAAGNNCGTCTDPSSVYLGVGCSDPYGASLNGSQSRLGPKSQVNATTGAFTWPHADLPQTGTLDGRIRVFTNDINPALNTGARYFVESQYVHPQDASSGNGHNNASYREAFVETESGGGWDIEVGSSPTVRQQPAINAWKADDPGVQLFVIDVPGDGRIVVGMRTTQPIKGTGYHTEIAIENLTSHQSVRSLIAKFGSDDISNPGFNDVDYQFEAYSGTDWLPFIDGNEIEWFTDTFASNQNANAIRWNTLYSFWCDSELPPRSLTLGMFRPGTVAEMSINLIPSVVPDAFKLGDGIQVGGQYSDVNASDDQYLEMDPSPTKNPLKQRVEIIAQAASTSASPADFAFRLEANMAGGPAGDVLQSIELFNLNTNEFELIDVRPVGTTDESVEVTPTGDWTRFIQPGTNEITARLIWTTEGGFAGAPFFWSVDIDEAVWLIAD